MIKRLFGEHITSRLVSTQNREISLRCIAYNMHRLTNLIIVLMVSRAQLYIKGRISDAHYNVLDKIISDYVEKVNK